MPSLGADMEEGTVIEWLVQPGDRVERGDIVATIDTDKAEIDVETFESGVIEELLIEPGRKVPVGTPLARIGTGAVGAPETAPPAPPVAEPPAAAPVAAPSTPPSPQPSAPAMPARREAPLGGRPRISPLARRVAEQLGVDVSTVTGTGLAGAVTRADVERAAAVEGPPPARPAAAPPAAAPEALPPEGAPARREAADRAASMRRAVGAAMAKSHREIPHYYLGTWIDMSTAMRWLETTNRERPVRERLLYSALLLRAVALAAREVPEVNGFWRDDAFEASEAVHLGVGISLPGGGLIAPAILDAGELAVGELMAALRDLVERARGGGLRGSELTSGTITVTNLGERGVETVFGLIYPPQVALVGFGKLVEKPWAQDGLVGARTQVHASLSGDHRASNGHRGAVYLAAIDRLLQRPEQL
jgi:pyruvate dehydrogenase E2 component (dihydrolipoamide acetyltransferase)